MASDSLRESQITQWLLSGDPRGLVGFARGLGDGAGEEQAIGRSLMAIAPFCGPAAPFVMMAAVFLQALAAFGVGEGCGVTCIQATSIVNQAEPYMQANVDAYESGDIDQKTAQTAFKAIWLSVQSSCGQIPGAAGQNCVSERKDGSCKWKQADPPKYPGQPNQGECFNWFNAYWNPLTLPALTPFVAVPVAPPAPDPSQYTYTNTTPTTGTTPPPVATSDTSSSMLPLLALAAVVGLVVWA